MPAPFVLSSITSLIRVAGILILLLTAGCVGMDWPSQGEAPKTGATQEKAPGPEPRQAAAPQDEAVAITPAQTATKPDVPVAVEPVVPPVAPPTTISTQQSPDRPAAPAVIPSTKAPAPPAQIVPAPKKDSAAPPAPTPTAAPLDLASLEKRLKETEAIGVFTKLTLKNQVDDLLDQFRAYYQGQAKTTLAALRQPYDQLLLKVLSLLQDRDPPLASAIAQSREAIWSILSDPNKFKNI